MERVGIVVKYRCMNFPDFQDSPKHCLQKTAQPVDRRWEETLAKLDQQFPRKAHSAGQREDTMSPKPLVYVLGGKAGDFSA